jgi:hypothetical protein
LTFSLKRAYYKNTVIRLMAVALLKICGGGAADPLLKQRRTEQRKEKTGKLLSAEECPAGQDGQGKV